MKPFLKVFLIGLMQLFAAQFVSGQIYFSEGFNGNAFPSGWILADSGFGPCKWMIHAPATGLATMNGSNFLFVNSDSGGSASSTSNETITSPQFNAGSGQPLFLSFSHFFRKRNNRQDTGRVEVFHNGTWHEVYRVAANTGLGNAPVTEKINISAYAGPAFQVRFRYKSLRGWYWAIDDLKVYSPWPADLGVSGIFENSGACGITLPLNLKVWVKNYGSAMQTGFPVHYKAAGQAAVTETFGDSLFPGDSAQFTFSTAITSSISNSFGIISWTSLSADSDALNDSASAQINLAPSGFSPVEFTNFDGTNLSQVHPGWEERSGLNPQPSTSAWGVSTAAEATGLGSVTARVNLYTTGKSEWIISPAFVPDSAASLRYKVAVTNWNTPEPDAMGSDDSVIVKVSTDCGQTWQNLVWYTAADALGNQLTDKSVSLAAYAGLPIQVAFYASEGSTDDDNDYDFHIDQIKPWILSANDLQLADLQLPGGNCGVPATFPVRVRLVNSGSLTQSSAPITYQVSGQSPVSQTFSINLAPAADTIVEFSQAVSIAAGGNFTMSAWVSLPADINTQDDSVLAKPFVRAQSGFAILNFTGYNGDNLGGGWQEFSGTPPLLTAGSSWANANAEQITGLGSESARINLYSSVKKEWIISPSINFSTGKALKFKVSVTNWTTAGPDEMGSDDSLIVKISGDCGLSWQNLRSFTLADNLENSFTEFSIPLSSYVGQTVRLAFYATEGITDDANDYDLHIDAIELINLSPTDVGLNTLILPTAECGLPSTLPVKIKLVNFGTQAQTGISLGYSVNGGSPVFANYASSLAPGESVIYEFAQQADISQPGTYQIKAWASVSGDQDNGNDTLVSEPLSPTPQALPSVDFTGFDGTNLSNLFPGWLEKSGNEPTGTSSFWNIGTASQIASLGSNTARVGILNNTRREWLISPGFRPAPQSELRFKIALTSVNFAVPGTLGGDDSLKVLISTNCGQSWELLQAYTAQSGLTNSLVQKNIDLSAYQGQSCLIGFKATSGNLSNTQTSDIHLDDIATGPLTTSSASLLLSGNIRIVPNPAHGGIISIQGIGENEVLRFFSSTGLEVYPKMLESSSRKFDLGELPRGMYLMRTGSGISAGFVIP